MREKRENRREQEEAKKEHEQERERDKADSRKEHEKDREVLARIADQQMARPDLVTVLEVVGMVGMYHLVVPAYHWVASAYKRAR